MADIIKEQWETVVIPNEKTGKMQTANKDIEWYKKELAAMRRIAHTINQDRELLKKKLITIQKHEEIKEIALGLYYHNYRNTHNGSAGFLECWEEATRIYNFVKRKQAETSDDKSS